LFILPSTPLLKEQRYPDGDALVAHHPDVGRIDLPTSAASFAPSDHPVKGIQPRAQVDAVQQRFAAGNASTRPCADEQRKAFVHPLLWGFNTRRLYS
jgi:hypothetical protein